MELCFLEAEGLNHRTVDRQARLPEGSTSNLFRTRAALLGAVCDGLTERDLEQLSEAAAKLSATTDGTPEKAAALADIVEQWAEHDALAPCARLELFLTARRDAKVAAILARARAAFRDFTSSWLASISKGGGTARLGGLMALIEGLTMAQLLHAESSLSCAELEAEIGVWLRAIAE